MGRLTTHVLDTAHGCPGAGIPLELYALDPQRTLLARLTTNADGRTDAPLLADAELRCGRYELVFQAGAYFAARGLALAEPAFVDEVVLRFGISDVHAHYHVPLLVSPYSYSTYRGS